MLPQHEKSIILVTYSISSECKPFAAPNLAAVMVIYGKKTIVLEFDIRKHKILKELSINMKNHKGITNYPMGKVTIDDINLPIERLDNLYVIGWGPIPPNPLELIQNPNLE